MVLSLTCAKEHESVTFTKFFHFLDKKQFIDLCEEVLVQNGDCTQARLLIFYGALFYLFYEYSTMQTQHPMVNSFDQYATLCRQNLEVVLSSLNLLMPATLENIQALLLAVSISLPTPRLTSELDMSSVERV